MGNADKIFSIVTWAAIAGLVILNGNAFASIFNAVGSNTVNYVKAVQGR